MIYYTQIIKNKELIGVIESANKDVIDDFIYGKNIEFSKVNSKYFNKIKQEFGINIVSLNTKNK